MRRVLLFAVLFVIALESALAPPCNVQGYVYLHNGTAVPGGTFVNISNQGTGLTIATQTGAPWPIANYYFQTFATCTHGVDTFFNFAWINAFLRGSQMGLGTGTLVMNITFVNNPPYWTAALPDQSMLEDNTTGINNAINLSAYAADYENSPLTYQVVSQSNSSLASASIDTNFIDIGAPTANASGTNTVCVRANDGEDASTSTCFTITVTAMPDIPSFTAASDNATGYIHGGVSVRVTATASDIDGDTVTLYVCNSSQVNAAGCTQTQRCTATAASNPSCTFASESDTASHIWYAFIYDATARAAALNFNDSYLTDVAAPTPGSVLVEGGAYYLRDTTVDFTWNGFSDTGSGIGMYYYSFTDASGTTSGSSAANTTSAASLLGASQGNNTVYVWAADSVGNIGSDANDWIWVDTVNPALDSWSIGPSDLRDNYVGAFTVNVTVTDITWNYSLPPKFRYRIDSGAWSTWQDMTLLSGTTYNLTIQATWSTLSTSTLYWQVNATDDLGNSNVTQLSEYINTFNIAPVLAVIGDQSVFEDQNLSFTISAVDGDNDTLSFFSNHNFTFAPLDDSSAIAWWVPPNDHVGLNTVTFWVDDGIENDTETLTITVQPVNDAPVLTAVGNLYGYIHIPLVHYLHASDVDNENNYTLDNNLLIFDLVQSYRWLNIESLFNVSSQEYYGVINFTPLLSHIGSTNLTIYVTDGTEVDAENITLTVGYCGDLDSGSEPWCDEEYETCESCPTDCGSCGEEAGNDMTILVDPRNCLGKNFTLYTYRLWARATCNSEGAIIFGKEVCGNLSGAKVDIYQLQYGLWQKIDEYLSDSNGEITFVPVSEGEYKLVGTKRDYPTAFQYLEIHPCIEDRTKDEPTAQPNATEKPPEVEKPTTRSNTTKEPEVRESEPSTFSVILWYIIVPALFVVCIVLGYYYYDKNKNDVVWILQVRIWCMQRYKIAKKWVLLQYKRIREYLGFGK
jgi:hypothetical protein